MSITTKDLEDQRDSIRHELSSCLYQLNYAMLNEIDNIVYDHFAALIQQIAES